MTRHQSRTRPLLLALLAASVALAGCLTDGAPAQGDSDGDEVVLLSHSSFAISDDVLAQFEAEHNATVRVVELGDAGEALNVALLNKDAPLGDLLYGVDNTFLHRALDEELFQPYTPEGADAIPDRFVLDPQWRATPVDHGYVALNYDKAALQEAGLAPPQGLEELTDEKWRGKLVVMNPATSSPGLAFLLATVAHFGEDDDYDYLDYWRDLKANDVAITQGWSDAYYARFTMYGGDRPLVVSYTTSPAAEVYFAEEALTEPPTGNVLAPGATFEQVEFVGLLNNSRNPDLAKALIDFMVSETFQEDIPANMFVYPVNENAETPDFFEHAPVPEEPAEISPERIAENRDAYISAWFDVMVS